MILVTDTYANSLNRTKKLPFETVMLILIFMGGNSLYKELLESIFWPCKRTYFTRFPFGQFVSSCPVALMKPSLPICSHEHFLKWIFHPLFLPYTKNKTAWGFSPHRFGFRF
ncbi:hypothetical protein NST69_18615 [Paenibacillus sp. FSL P2-0089]|uniref:hypothetical protein n=1 Tax=Paenibacillus sp. FSL P2-0089 TaxID=2954526 RepID=UPI00315A77AE